MRRVVSSLCVLLGLVSSGLVSGHAHADPVAQAAAQPNKADQRLLGEWWTEGREGRIKFIQARDGTFRGITMCCVPKVPSPENPVKDMHNPNPALRDRATIGIVLIWKLNYDSDGEYNGGYLYNPRDGNTYRINIKIIDAETIKIRGYIAIPLLGQSQIWKRARDLNPKVAPAAQK
jgi:uncharacterized protein (DUF2147 family)